MPATYRTFPWYAVFLLAFCEALLPGCNKIGGLTEQEHIQKAKAFQAKGDLRASVIELKNALQKNSNNAEVRLLLGEIYIDTGQGSDAEKELLKARDLGVNEETIKVPLGRAFLLQGNYNRALNEIKASANSSMKNRAKILQIHGDAQIGLRRFEDGCHLFQQALDSDPANIQAHWGLAKCALAKGDFDGARAKLDVAFKLDEKNDGTWGLLGYLERVHNNLPAAESAYVNAIKLNPKNIDAFLSLASIHLDAGKLDAAKIDIEKINKLAPKSLIAEYTQALLAFHQKKYPQARDALQNVFQITSDYMPGVLLAGVTAYSLGSYQQAESYLKRYLNNFPNQAYPRRMLAATLIKQNQPNKALEILAPIIMPSSQDAQALALAGQAQFMTQNPTVATAYFEKAIALDPKNAAIRTQQGMNFLISGNTLAAVSQLEAAAALAPPEQYQADSLLITSFLQRKEYDKALTASDSMEKKFPNSPIAYNLRGNAYLGKNDVARARKSFEQAAVIDPAFLPAATSLARLDLRDNQPDAARKRFETILERDKNNVQAMVALADLAAIQKQGQEYERWLRKAAERVPSYIVPRAKLADYYLSQKDTARALNIAHEAANANPNNPEALDLLAATQLATGDNESALATYAKQIEKAPDAPISYLRLAMAQMVAKKFIDARVSLQKAIELKPDFTQAQDAMIRLDQVENKPDAALRIAHQIQIQHSESPLGFEREADIQLSQKHADLAIKAYEQALLRGSGSNSFIHLIEALALVADAKTVEQRVSSWFKQHPNDNIVRAYVAKMYLSEGKDREAIALYEGWQRADPNNFVVLANLAALYMQTKNDHALPTAEKALELAPKHPVVLDTVGWILVQQGQSARGLDMLRKALTIAPDSANIRYHYAIALVRTGSKAEAKKELKKLISSGQKFPELETARKQLNGL